MNIHFWGVRGSVPTPLTPQQVQSKIMAAVQRITASDIESEDAMARFVSNLPDSILGTAGGNTSCVELICGNTQIILDAGTGIRLLGKSRRRHNKYNIILSHLHWDHIQGFPYFDPIYNPQTNLVIYSGHEDAENFLKKQMEKPFYPVDFENLTKNIKYVKVSQEKSFNIDEVSIHCCKMAHPGDSYSYSFSYKGKKIVYATDLELKSKEYLESEYCENVFKNADCAILDSQYTVEEAFRKANWGHSAFCYAVDFAIHWNIKKIFLFHHEPTYDDKKLDSILQAARWYAQYIEHSDIEIYLAREDLEIEI